MREKILTFCQKNFNRSDKTWFYVSKRTIWIKKAPWKTFNFRNMFVLWTKKIQLFWQKFGGFCQNCFFNFRRNFSKKNTFSEKNVFLLSFILFGHWSKTFRPCTKKTSMGLSKPQFTCLWDQCRKRNFFERNMVFLSQFDFELKSVNFLSGSFLRVLQSCNSCFRKNISKNNSLCEI